MKTPPILLIHSARPDTNPDVMCMPCAFDVGFKILADNVEIWQHPELDHKCVLCDKDVRTLQEEWK